MRLRSMRISKRRLFSDLKRMKLNEKRLSFIAFKLKKKIKKILRNYVSLQRR
jgi:hypothetical protein